MDRDDKKKIFAKIRSLNSMIEDYLDRMAMDEAEDGPGKKKEDE